METLLQSEFRVVLCAIICLMKGQNATEKKWLEVYLNEKTKLDLLFGLKRTISLSGN